VRGHPVGSMPMWIIALVAFVLGAIAAPPNVYANRRRATTASASAPRAARRHARTRRHRAAARLQEAPTFTAVARVAPPPAIARTSGPAPLVFLRVNNPETFVLTPDTDQGGFDASDLGLAAQAFAWRINGRRHTVHPRLLELVYRVQRHFGAPYVAVVSGFRNQRRTSRHTSGRAIDMSLPGVSIRDLAAYCHTFGFVGVGIYPRSGFVHLDVRNASYFWVDSSRPGRRGRVRPTQMDEAEAADALARSRGESPTYEGSGPSTGARERVELVGG